MEKVETALLAGLVSGDPILLVGSHGSGKTLLCQRLAESLGMKFWAYDASKAMFEDILGFPNPAGISEGRIEYIPTPLSIWDKEFILIDELSRAAPSMQNKWLEVIRARTVMGKKLGNLKCLMAAMNPPEYIGAHPLDEALAGRFAVVITVPSASQMEDSDLALIVSQISEEDAAMLKTKRKNFSRTGLKSFLVKCDVAGKRFPGKELKLLNGYVIAVSRFLASRGISVDGRRMGMMWRTLHGCALVTMARENMNTFRFAENEETLRENLLFTLPFAALGEKYADAALQGAHYHGDAVLKGSVPGKIFVFNSSLTVAADEFKKDAQAMPENERKAALTKFLSAAFNSGTVEGQAEAVTALVKLAKHCTEGKLDLPPDDCGRLLGSAGRLVMPSISAECSISEDLEASVRNETLLDYREPAALSAFRLGWSAENGKPGSARAGRRRRSSSFDPLVKAVYEQIKTGGIK